MWPNGFDDPPEYTYQPDPPPQLVSFHRDGSRGWLEVVDMAEMTELDALKIKLADKQMIIDNASQFEQQTMAVLKGLKDGTLALERVVLTETGYQVIAAVEAEAEQVAREASE